MAYDSSKNQYVVAEAIADLALTAPSANEIELRDAINSILAALRDAGTVSTT